MGLEGGEEMSGRELKEWAKQLSDDCVIEVKHYSWEGLDPTAIRAISTPQKLAQPLHSEE